MQFMKPPEGEPVQLTDHLLPLLVDTPDIDVEIVQVRAVRYVEIAAKHCLRCQTCFVQDEMSSTQVYMVKTLHSKKEDNCSEM